MDLSVVIVSYKTPDHLRRCLESLSRDKTSLQREVIVVDNESQDSSPEVARSFDGVHVIESGANLGFSGGVNRGLDSAKGRYAVVLNPDIEVHAGALEHLVRHMDDNPNVGLAGPKLLNTDGTLQHSCRRFYTLSTILLRRTFLGKLFPNAQPLRRHLMLDYDHREVRSVDWVAGAAMMVRMQAVQDVGPMDERYFLYFEDVDWCRRMHTRGWEVQYVPQAVLTHHWQRASAALSASTRAHIQSGLKFYERWGVLSYMVRQFDRQLTVAGLLLLDTVAVVGSFLLAYWLRQQLAFVLEKPVFPISFYFSFLTTSLLVFLGSFMASGMYRDFGKGDWVDEGFRVARGSTLGLLVVMAATFLLELRGFSRILVLASWPLTAVVAFAARVMLHKLFLRGSRDRLVRRRLAVIGEGSRAEAISDMVSGAQNDGFEVVRLKPRSGITADQWLHLLADERIRDVVVGVEDAAGAAPALVETLRRAGLSVRVVTPMLQELPGYGHLERAGNLTWLDLSRPGLRPSGFRKRLMDISLAGVSLILLAVPALALMTGRGVAGRGVWEPRWSYLGLWGEPRSARRLSGGGWLRNFPLLFPVLRGHMSMVGLRPLPPGSSAPGGPEWQRVRESYRPGLTGLWSLRPVATPEEEVRQELSYLETWSPEGDLKLLMRALIKSRRDDDDEGTPHPADRSPSKTTFTRHNTSLGLH